jgi:hypothetical protein
MDYRVPVVLYSSTGTDRYHSPEKRVTCSAKAEGRKSRVTCINFRM